MKDYIFREYDIRGVVETDFPPEVVRDLGRAFGTYILRRGGSAVTLSGDIRLTTPVLKENFAEGLLSTGADVRDIGILPTPANYFSLYHLDVAGAVQITGSHNPPEYNGFKLTEPRGAVYGREIQVLKELILERDFETGTGRLEEVDVLKPYLDMLEDKITLERPLKVVMDCGNAAAVLAAPEIFRRMGMELTELFCTVDGTFPNHHPDPTEEKNLQDLIAEMKTGNYD